MGEGNKILVVDDQEGIRRLLKETCSLLGYEAVTASSGEEALDLLDQSIKVALIDMKMPGLNGMETLCQVRGRQPDIKGIIMTGYGESLDESLRKGVHEVIQKPFNLDRIKILLEEALGSGE